MDAIKQWIKNALISLDQFANTVFLGGYPDETISSRMGRNLDTCRTCRFLCKILDKINTNHCQSAVQAVKDEAYVPPELKDKP